MISQHKPTIGRQVWLYSGNATNAADPKQAFAATVVYVDAGGNARLTYTNHWGTTSTHYELLPIHDPQDTDAHGAAPAGQDSGWYATWMPYQKKTMDTQQGIIAS